MCSYHTDPEELYPESGYSLILMDEMKAPTDDDFINELAHFETVEAVEWPPSRSTYSYMIYSADGSIYERDDWPPE